MYSPTSEQFKDLASQGNLIPVTRRLLADFETPLSAYRKLRGSGESFLFESVEGGEHLGRFSFVGFNPRAIIRQTGDRVEVLRNGQVVESFSVAKGSGAAVPAASAGVSSPNTVIDGLAVVEKMLEEYSPVALPSLPRFTGGAVGFI